MLIGKIAIQFHILFGDIAVHIIHLQLLFTGCWRYHGAIGNNRNVLNHFGGGEFMYNVACDSTQAHNQSHHIDERHLITIHFDR